jgi:fumarate reductase subunit C
MKSKWVISFLLSVILVLGVVSLCWAPADNRGVVGFVTGRIVKIEGNNLTIADANNKLFTYPVENPEKNPLMLKNLEVGKRVKLQLHAGKIANVRVLPVMQTK